MRGVEVWAVADSIVSPLGTGSDVNYAAVAKGETALRKHQWNGEPLVAALIDHSISEGLTRFETACVNVLDDLLSQTRLDTKKTLFVLSTTKGNTELLDHDASNHAGLNLSYPAAFLSSRYGFAKHVVVSNACISGVLALIIAKRFLQQGGFEHAVVVGADVLSELIVSGFHSLLALSDEHCKPFDASRKGLNLGEGAGAVVLTTKPEMFPKAKPVRVGGCGVSNDANHISGPSRTGEELALAIRSAIKDTLDKNRFPDFVSAHGTATIYNDEMEAKAFALAGVASLPTHSLKAYYGHTLGAAGVIESIICMATLRNGMAIQSAGFDKSGVSVPLNICRKTENASLKTILKTASGFGGCNAAITFEME